jgi:hypothetical protein
MNEFLIYRAALDAAIDFYMDNGRGPEEHELDALKKNHPVKWIDWADTFEEAKRHWLDCKADQEQKELEQIIDTTPDHIERRW